MKAILATILAAGMTLAAFAQSVSTIGVSMNPTNFTVKGAATNFHMANAHRGVATVETLAELAATTNGQHGAVVMVRGRLAAMDWGQPKPFVLQTNSVAATNKIHIANAGGLGRWVHPWDGDASAFGVTTESTDNGASINEANTAAISQGVSLRFPEGTFNIGTNYVMLSSHTHFKGAGMGKTILRRYGTPSNHTNLHAYSTLQTPGTFNPYLTNGGHTNGVVNCTVTNITLEDFTLAVDDTSYPGFGIALFASDSAFIRDVEITTHSNHWALTIFGNRTVVNGVKIRNAGWIYRDGIHFMGGDGLTVTGCDIETGDDCVAMAPGGALDTELRNVNIVGNHLVSTHAHAVRINQENPSATNTFNNIMYIGAVGVGGIYRNGPIRITSASTNFASGTFPIRSVTLAHLHFTMGPTNAVEVSARSGAYITDVDGLSMNDVNVGETVEPSFYLFDCGRVTMRECVGLGGTTVSFANAVSAVNVRDLQIFGGYYANGKLSTNCTPIGINGCSNVMMSGVILTNGVAGRGVIQTITTASGRLSIQDSRLEAPDTAVLLSVLPTYFTMVNNYVSAPENVQYVSSYTIPENYIVQDNDGQSMVRRFMAAQRFDIKRDNGDSGLSWIDTQQDTYARLVNTNGGFVVAPSTNTGAKIARWGMTRHVPTDKPLAFVIGDDTSGTFPMISIGGGSGTFSQPQWVQVYATGTNNTDAPVMGLFRYPTASSMTSLSLFAKGITNGVIPVYVGAPGTGPGGVGRALYAVE